MFLVRPVVGLKRLAKGGESSGFVVSGDDEAKSRFLGVRHEGKAILFSLK
jgi:hypothetical protein